VDQIQLQSSSFGKIVTIPSAILNHITQDLVNSQENPRNEIACSNKRLVDSLLDQHHEADTILSVEVFGNIAVFMNPCLLENILGLSSYLTYSSTTASSKLALSVSLPPTTITIQNSALNDYCQLFLGKSFLEVSQLETKIMIDTIDFRFFDDQDQSLSFSEVSETVLFRISDHVHSEKALEITVDSNFNELHVQTLIKSCQVNLDQSILTKLKRIYSDYSSLSRPRSDPLVLPFDFSITFEHAKISTKYSFAQEYMNVDLDVEDFQLHLDANGSNVYTAFKTKKLDLYMNETQTPTVQVSSPLMGYINIFRESLLAIEVEIDVPMLIINLNRNKIELLDHFNNLKFQTEDISGTESTVTLRKLQVGLGKGTSLLYV
jgi:hypothetical protein